ncbi:MAG: hypothetical protein PVF68_14390, partial [Acidobacteriota bacterium]
DPELAERHCPERSGQECTLVHIMLVVHNMPPEVRRRLIAALYPAYGIAAEAEPETARRPQAKASSRRQGRAPKPPSREV